MRRNSNEGPYEQGQPRDGHDDGFDDEEPADFLRGDEHERELERPVDEVAEHAWYVDVS